MTPNFTMAMPAQTVVSAVLEDLTELTLIDMCHACGATSEVIIELVHEGVLDITPFTTLSNQPLHGDWRFTGLHLHRARVAVRLHRDLGVNSAGAGLALQLMDELDDMRGVLQQLRSA